MRLGQKIGKISPQSLNSDKLVFKSMNNQKFQNIRAHNIQKNVNREIIFKI